MEKMIGKKDPNREETRESFIKLNNTIKKMITEREDIDVLFVNYNDILLNPRENIEKIIEFLRISNNTLDKMLQVVDKRLYRQRRIKTTILKK